MGHPISVDLAHQEIFHAKIGKGGIKIQSRYRWINDFRVQENNVKIAYTLFWAGGGGGGGGTVWLVIEMRLIVGASTHRYACTANAIKRALFHFTQMSTFLAAQVSIFIHSRVLSIRSNVIRWLIWGTVLWNYFKFWPVVKEKWF